MGIPGSNPGRGVSKSKMIQTIQLISTVVLLIASITDFNRREVPDTLSYGFIILMSLITAYSLFALKDVNYILNLLASFIVFLLIALFLFYSNLFGGGDAKLLIGLSFSLPLLIFPFNKYYLLDNLMKSPGVSFLIDSLFVGGLYGLGYAFYLAFRHWNKFKKRFDKLIKRHTLSFKLFVLSFILSLIITLAILRKNSADISLILAFTLLTFSLLLAVVILPLYVFMKAVDEVVLTRRVSPKKLVEGDWIIKPVKDEKGKIIVSNKDNGVSNEQIKKLKELYSKGIIKTVKVKDGIPFVPSILLTYLLVILLHDNLLIALSKFLVGR